MRLKCERGSDNVASALCLPGPVGTGLTSVISSIQLRLETQHGRFGTFYEGDEVLIDDETILADVAGSVAGARGPFNRSAAFSHGHGLLWCIHLAGRPDVRLQKNNRKEGAEAAAGRFLYFSKINSSDS